MSDTYSIHESDNRGTEVMKANDIRMMIEGCWILSRDSFARDWLKPEEDVWDSLDV